MTPFIRASAEAEPDNNSDTPATKQGHEHHKDHETHATQDEGQDCRKAGAPGWPSVYFVSGSWLQGGPLYVLINLCVCSWPFTGICFIIQRGKVKSNKKWKGENRVGGKEGGRRGRGGRKERGEGGEKGGKRKEGKGGREEGRGRGEGERERFVSRGPWREGQVALLLKEKFSIPRASAGC